MKKRYYLMTILLIALLSPVLAQTTEQKPDQNPEKRIIPKEEQVYIGLSANINSSWIMYQQTYGEPFLKYQFTVRPGVNAQIGYDWDYHWGIRAEVGFAMLGQKYKDTQYGKPTTRNIKTNYIQIPFLFKYRTHGEKVKFYVLTGFQVNFLVSATQKYLRDGVQAPDYVNYKGETLPVGAEDITDRYTKVNLALRLDLGVDIFLTNSLFLNVGLSNMYSGSQIVVPSWRYRDVKGEYHISHNLYSGLNFGINYIF
jgi:hypothetical protein